MKAFRQYFLASLVFGLIFGLVGGSSVRFFFAVPTADWAANGVPLLERVIQSSEWWLLGFLPGACLGVIVGPLVYWLTPTDEWIDADATGGRAKRVEKAFEVVTTLLVTGIFAFGLWVVFRAA